MTVVRSERQYGSFEIAIEIPERYVRKWTGCRLREGVLRITFPIDEDEEEAESSI